MNCPALPAIRENRPQRKGRLSSLLTRFSDGPTQPIHFRQEHPSSRELDYDSSTVGCTACHLVSAVLSNGKKLCIVSFHFCATFLSSILWETVHLGQILMLQPPAQICHQERWSRSWTRGQCWLVRGEDRVLLLSEYA